MRLYTITCPVCHQRAGWPCQSLSGAITTTHAARLRLQGEFDAARIRQQEARDRKRNKITQKRFPGLKESIRRKWEARAKARKRQGYEVTPPPYHLGEDRVIDWLVTQAVSGQVKCARRKTK